MASPRRDVAPLLVMANSRLRRSRRCAGLVVALALALATGDARAAAPGSYAFRAIALPSPFAQPLAINDRGQVVGGAPAFLWEDGQIEILAGGTSDRAHDINDAGVVVGRRAIGDDGYAFV